MPSFNNTQNIREFSQELEVGFGSINLAFNDYKNRVIVHVHNRIVELTPIDTGNAKASWNVSLGSPDFTVSPFNRSNRATKEQAVRYAKRTQSRLKSFTLEDVYITNGNDYITLLENGRSKSQAPAGMVAIALSEAENLQFVGRVGR